MNRLEQLDRIKRQLGVEGRGEDQVLLDLFDGWLSQALAVCNRRGNADPPGALLAIVRDTAAAAYNRRGDEGVEGESAGEQSYSYEQLHQVMQQRLIQAGLRVYRL